MVCLTLFFLGIVVGSFLNVLIDRLPHVKSPAESGDHVPNHGESIIFGRSRCENCRTPLPWYDLVPLLSFVWLRGRCRFCQTRITRRIPVVELLTGIGFAFIFWLVTERCGFTADKHGVATSYQLLVTSYCLLFSSFVVLFFTDLEYGVLPDKIVLPVTVVVLFWRVAESLIPGTKYQILNIRHWILPAFGLSLFFLLLIAITRGKGMGFGDVKLGFLMGLVLGWPKTLVAAFLAFLFGAVVSVILILAGRKHFGQTVPFGPFLIVGTGVAVFWGSRVWSWYLGML